MKLYNSLTRQIETLEPLQPGKVSLYTCGLTVYSHPHIGNWAAYTYWDILVRTLQAEGYEVDRIQNITDVGHLTDDGNDGEDKLAKGARREQTTAWAVAEKYSVIADCEAEELNLLSPDAEPKASDYIDEQIAWNKKLEAAGYTYEIEGKGLYFDTAKLEDYGKLANVDLDQLQSGKRIDDSGKRNPTDFVLWRLSPEDIDPEVNWEWDSPWGKGIPGWHLECSVMAAELLGEQIDIHTGGIDHINVHHTNEIAQTEAITHKPFSQFWLHANHIKVDGTKMSKSLGNLYTLIDIQQKGYNLDAFKLMVLSSHYRTEGNFTWEIMDAAQARLQRWQATADLHWQTTKKGSDNDLDIDIKDKIISKLSSDLNTPQAIAAVDNIISSVDHDNPVFKFDMPTLSMTVSELLNINFGGTDINDDQKQLLAERAEARSQNDWERSDSIRDELEQQGIGINDTNQGQRWYRIVKLFN